MAYNKYDLEEINKEIERLKEVIKMLNNKVNVIRKQIDDSSFLNNKVLLLEHQKSRDIENINEEIKKLKEMLKHLEAKARVIKINVDIEESIKTQSR